MCNQPFANMILDKKTMRIVNALEIFCKRKERGCGWTGELAHADKHEGECMYNASLGVGRARRGLPAKPCRDPVEELQEGCGKPACHASGLIQEE